MVSNPTVRSTILTTTSTSGADEPGGRRIAKDGNDHRMLLQTPEFGSSYNYVSGTDPSTWTNDDLQNHVASQPWGASYNSSNDVVYSVYKDSDASEVQSHHYDPRSSDTVGSGSKTIASFPNSEGTGGGLTAVGPNGKVYAVAFEIVKSMGNNLFYPHLYSYSPGGSWTKLSKLGSSNVEAPSMTVDSQQRVHVVGFDPVNGGGLLYYRYDAASGTLAVQDEVIQSSPESSWEGRVIIDGSDRPIVSSYQNGDLEQYPQLYRRDSGSWTQKNLGDGTVGSAAHVITTPRDDKGFLIGAILHGGEIHWYSGYWGDLGGSTTFEQLTSSGTVKSSLHAYYEEWGGHADAAKPLELTYVNEDGWTVEFVRAEHAAATSDPGSLTAASTMSFTASESVSPKRDAGSLTAATATPTTASSSTRSGDAGSLTAAQATPLAAGSTATATDAGGLTAATTTVLVADETVIVADTQTGTYQVGGGIEFGGPPSL